MNTSNKFVPPLWLWQYTKCNHRHVTNTTAYSQLTQYFKWRLYGFDRNV